MRVTIVPVDNKVVVEGELEIIDCSLVDEEVHAVQWYGEVGEVEYKYDYIANTRRHNERIEDFTPYQHLVDLWMVEAQKEIPVAA